MATVPVGSIIVIQNTIQCPYCANARHLIHAAHASARFADHCHRVRVL
jgi:hypothetical protein